MSAGIDRRRVNGPPAGTYAPIFDPPRVQPIPDRLRGPRNLRKIFTKTGLTPSASGSAYLEVEQPQASQPSFQAPPTPKLICTVHGPRPLPSSVPFSSSLVLSTYVKFATFASERRRGYLRDPLERDMAVHLEAALRAVIIAERMPKSCLEVVVTILETDAGNSSRQAGSSVQWVEDDTPAMTPLLSGCITVASAALVHAGIDCVDMVTGGAAALVHKFPQSPKRRTTDEPAFEVVLDPRSHEHRDFALACVVGYLGSRDEIADIWIKGGIASSWHLAIPDAKDTELLIQGAIEVAAATQTLLVKCTRDQN